MTKEHTLILKCMAICLTNQKEQSLMQIQKFLNISKHSLNGMYFNDTRNNLNMFPQFPELKNDITLIEDKLTDYIYDFEKYEKSSEKKNAW